jgi:hypothetical protein
MFKNISLFLLLSFVFVPPASADFLGIGGWTEKHVTKPLKRKVIDPVVKETKHQMQVVRRGKLYKGADKLVQEGRNSKAYKAADKVLVSASRAVKNDCSKALTTAFTPLVGAVCGKVTTAALGAACAATLGTMGTPLVMPAGIASVALCVPIVGYTSQIGCNGPLVKGAGLLNSELHGPFQRINVYHRYKETINKFKTEQAGRLAKLTCDIL